MGPAEEHPHLTVAGGVDHAVDQVKRGMDFVRRHPEVAITTPRQNGTGLFLATWTDGLPHDGVVTLAKHEQLRILVDYLEARFDR